MNLINSKKGFTLIELLVVITIIGILSTVILGSLSSARGRGYDSKIKQQLRNFRTASEVYFANQNPNGYGPATSSCTEGIFNDISQSNGTPGIYIDPGNLPSFVELRCASTDTSFAIKATLHQGNSYWCVDNKGAFREIAGTIGSPVTECP